jgi:hypothetical protein
MSDAAYARVKLDPLRSTGWISPDWGGSAVHRHRCLESPALRRITSGTRIFRPFRGFRERPRAHSPLIRAISSAAQSKNQMTRDRPEKNNITRMTRRNVTSLTFRNIKMPSNVPATSAGRLIAKSIKTFDDRSLRDSIRPSAENLHGRDEWLNETALLRFRQTVHVAPDRRNRSGHGGQSAISPPPNPTRILRRRFSICRNDVKVGRNRAAQIPS